MAPLGLGEYPNFQDLPISFAPGVPMNNPNLSHGALPQMASLGHGKNPIFQDLPISLPNQLNVILIKSMNKIQWFSNPWPD